MAYKDYSADVAADMRMRTPKSLRPLRDLLGIIIGIALVSITLTYHFSDRSAELKIQFRGRVDIVQKDVKYEESNKATDELQIRAVRDLRLPSGDKNTWQEALIQVRDSS